MNKYNLIKENFILLFQTWHGLKAEARQTETRNIVIFLECEVAYISIMARQFLTRGAIR